MEMKDENKEFKAYFENFTPDADTTERMYKTVTARGTMKKTGSRRMWKLLLAAALSMTLAVFTVFAASPAVRKYFFPSLGIVEIPADTGEEAEPLYLVMDDTDRFHRGFTTQFGYWQDGTVRFWISSYRDYEEMDPSELLEENPGTIKSAPLRMSYGVDPNCFYIEIPDITAEEAKVGIVFNGITIRFTKTPREYSSFSVENDGIRLTLIPLTENRATFGYILEYTDGRPGTLELNNGLPLQPQTYDYKSKIQLRTDKGYTYDMINYEVDGINILTADGKVYGTGTKILCKELFVTASFDETQEGALLTLPVPEIGNSPDLNLDFTFPDGAKGRLNFLSRIPSDIEDPSGTWDSVEYLYYSIDFVTDEGKYIAYSLRYPEEYEMTTYRFANEYNEQYELSLPDSLSYLGYYMRHGEHGMRQTGIEVKLLYLNNGQETVDFALTNYCAAILGDWNMDLTLQPRETE